MRSLSDIEKEELVSEEDPKRALLEEFGVDAKSYWTFEAERELKRLRRERADYEYYKRFEALYFARARELGELVSRRLGL